MRISFSTFLRKKLSIISAVVLCFAAHSLAGVNQSIPRSDEYVLFSSDLINSYLSSYNDQERLEIAKDLAIVRDICAVQPSSGDQELFYLATAGGPGSRKSTILERFLNNHPEFSTGTYLDPDQRALRFMVHTYYNISLNALASAEDQDYANIRKRAYEKWRAASNYITNSLLEEAAKTKKPITHGTTATGEFIEPLFKKLKNRGYEITLLLCSCPDELRSQAVTYRNTMQKFFQSTPEDALQKGKAFPAKMLIYFSHADTLYLFWSDNLFQPERLAAVLKDGKLEVVDQNAFGLFVKKYENDRKVLSSEGKDTPQWDELISIYSMNHHPSATR